jgi:hypothetical protein
MDSDITECWFCHRAILDDERANRSVHGGVVVHVDCLRHDARTDGHRPGDET